MNEHTKNLEKIFLLMKDFFAGKLDAQHVIQKWPNPENSMSREEALLIHELHHFNADEDIRAKDAEYAAIQIDGLKRILATLI